MKKIEMYTADWCSACKIVKSIVKSLENVEVEIIDVEKQTDRAVSLGIRNIPVLRFLNKDGSEKHRLVGNRTKEEIASYLE